MQVEITQFMNPFGDPRQRFAEVPDDCAVGYEALRRKGCRLTAEVLDTGLVSQCIEHEDGDFDMKIVANNGPRVKQALCEMICAFDEAKFDAWLRAITEE